MPVTLLTSKLTSFYGAYSPEFEVCAYGNCIEEALNNLTAELGGRVAPKLTRHATAYDKKNLGTDDQG
jgi:hypothetical protein